MIALHGSTEDGKELVLFVLEPGNLDKIRQGQPIHKWFNEFLPGMDRQVEMVICYTPDIDWVTKQIGKSRDMITIATAIEQSLTRKPVIRDSKSAEEMKRVF